MSAAAPEPPPPPPPGPPPAPASARAATRPGSLTTTWRTVLGLAWVGAFCCYAAVWQASVEIGFGLWWIGPRGDPTFLGLRLAPFLLSLAIVLHLVYARPAPLALSAAGALGALAWAVPDLSRAPALALVEVAIGVLLAVVTLCARSGREGRSAPGDGPARGPGGEAIGDR